MKINIPAAKYNNAPITMGEKNESDGINNNSATMGATVESK